MRLTSRTSVPLLVLGVCCAGLLIGLCNPVSSQEAKKVNPRIKELQQKRLVVLEQRADIASRLFSSGRGSYEEVHSTSAELLTARLDYAETREDRIKACDAAIKEAAEWQKLIQAQKEAARANMVTQLKAEADLLEFQIAREKLDLDQ